MINMLMTTAFSEFQKKNGYSIVWEEIINYRKYIGANLKWCIGDDIKVCFWIDYWVYI